MLNNLHRFSLKLNEYDCPSLIKQNNAEILGLFSSPEFKKIHKIKELQKLNALEIASFDYMFRYTHKDAVRLSVSVYLAHVGFPIPASAAQISLLSGLYTTINLSDNLNRGYSHFYSEVLRIKFIAERLKNKSNMLVVFDELFRGTNVKDAHDGSLAILSAFSKIRTCFFAISTHIIEIADELADQPSILFRKMEVLSHEKLPQYTYLMKDGMLTMLTSQTID